MQVEVGRDFEYALQTFTKRVLASGLLKEFKLRSAFESKRQRRIRKAIASRKRFLNKERKERIDDKGRIQIRRG